MKSGIPLIILGIIGILLAGVGFPAFLVWHIASLGLDAEGVLSEAEEPFLGPGEVVVELAEPGDYLLWFHYRTNYQEVAYDFPPELPAGMEVEMEALDSPAEVSWVPFGDEMDFTVEVNDVSRKSVGVFEVEMPGTYRLVVSGDFEPRVFSIATAPFDDLFGGIGTLLIVAILVGLSGVALLIFGIIVMLRNRSDGS